MEGAKPKTVSASTFGERVSEKTYGSLINPVFAGKTLYLMFVSSPQRQQRLTSSATKSWTSRGQKKATVGRRGTPGSSVTNSKLVFSGTHTLFFLTLSDRSGVALCVFQGCSLWLSVVLQHLTCSTARGAAGGAHVFLSGPTQRLSGLQVHSSSVHICSLLFQFIITPLCNLCKEVTLLTTEMGKGLIFNPVKIYI